jgi:type IV pilus assembly protein PilQ
MKLKMSMCNLNAVKKGLGIAFLIFFTTVFSFGQNYTEQQLRDKLDTLSLKSKGLNNTVQLNVSGLQLYEFVYSIGLENNLNISIEPSLNQTISYNFFDAQVKDILVFIYMNFEVEYEFVGTIISVKKRSIKKEKPVVAQTKDLDIKYNTSNEFLSLNLQNDTLWKVVEKITRLTDKNFVIGTDIRNKQVNAYFQNRPYEQVLDMFVKANGMTINKEKDGFYTILAAQVAPTNNSNGYGNSNGNNQNRQKANTDDLIIKKTNSGKLDVFANNVDLIEIIKLATQEANIHYVLHSTIDGKANLELKDITFEELLNNLFRTTKYNYFQSDNIFVIGESKSEGVRKSELIRLENRTVENVLTTIPKELLTDVSVTEFLQLNGLIATGGERGVAELKKFLSSIDIVVPMIQIDVMFLTSKSGNTNKTGIEAGLGSKPTTTGGTLFPGVDVKLGAKTINDLLSAISGFGILNLGQVTENFYVSLSALESNNVINIESTPKISTLNGQKASISIGQTDYYQETQVNVQTSVQQSGVINSSVWKDIQANMTVKIQPFVSADEQITMTISVTKSDFTPRKDPKAPPGSSTQSFESMVRVKNGEVILLGGLEEKSKSDTGSGVPILSRIPVLKWLFSSRNREKSKSKLHILIKPTVTY